MNEQINKDFTKIDPVILTPEVVDQFRLNFDDPSDALARDLVQTMQVDYADKIEKDPNYITIEGLMSGNATILDDLPSTRGKSSVERALSPDQIIVLFSNAKPATFLRPFLSEFAKSVPATEAMATTARVTGPRIIPTTTALGSSLGPAGTALGFTTGLLATGALSLLAGGATYLAGDAIEEKFMGADPVITPGQRSEYEAYRTLGGGAGAIRFPWLMDPKTNLSSRMMLKNISNEASKTRALNLTKSLDNIIGATGKSARRNVGLTATGELAATSGSALGAFTAEEIDPASTVSRLTGELIGGNALYSTVAKALPRVLGSTSTDDLSGVAVSAKQKKLFENINKLYSDYGTEQQYDLLIENLTSPEIKAQLQEAFPNVDFTAAQIGGDPLLMAVESQKAKGEPILDVARKKAERESFEFFNQFIKGLISTGDKNNIRQAAVLRKSIFDDMLRSGLQIKMSRFLQANEKLSKKPGKSVSITKQQLSESLNELVGDYLTAAGNKERELWSAVPNVDVLSPLSPDTPFSELPNFLQVFDQISYENPSVQRSFKSIAPVLFDFIDQSRKDLGLTPLPKFSDAEIATFNKFKDEYDTSVTRLSGYNAEKDLTQIMEEANKLPLSERSNYLRNQQEIVLDSLKNLSKPEGQKRLSVALDKAANLAGVEFTNQRRALQREAEVSDDVSSISSTSLTEARGKLLRLARSLAADPATIEEASKIGQVAEAINKDLNVEGFSEAYNIARDFTRAKHDFFTRSIVGDLTRSQRSGADKLPPEIAFEVFVKANPSLTLNRLRQLQGFAEFADQQNLPSFLPEETTLKKTDSVFTTTTNLIDTYLRSLKQVASKDVFDPKSGTTKTVINAQGLEDWKKENAEALEAFPQLVIDLKDASSAQRAVEVMEQSVKKAKKIARSQKDLAKLIDGMSPTVAVANAYESDTPLKSFRNLFALRRMGAPTPDARLAARTGKLRALRKARTEEIQKSGLKSDEVNSAFRTAILQHAYLKAGGEGSFNPQIFYQTLFQKMPKADQSIMDVADQFNIFPEKIKSRIKFMSEQLMKVQAADAVGRLSDPDAFAAEAGPIMEFYVGVLGSALGSRAFATAGGTGPGVISASNVGARELRKFLLELPAVSKLRAIDLMFTDPSLVASLIQKPKTETGKVRQYNKILNILNDKLFNTSVSMAPFVVRETFEEEDRGLDSPFAEDPAKEIPALREQLLQDNIKNLPPINLSQVNPPAQIPTATLQAQAQPSSGSADPNTRTRYASLFPDDPISGMLGSGGITNVRT